MGRRSLALAQHAERLGFSRYWVAEHHNMEGIASFDLAHAPAWARNPAAPVVMDDASEEFPTFTHPGTELLHLLEGEMVYRHGNQLYPMGPGDSLTFDAEVPHGPE